MRKGNLALALSFAMSVIGLAQNQQLQITNGPVVEGVGDTWAVVAWTTNEGASSVLNRRCKTKALSLDPRGVGVW